MSVRVLITGCRHWRCTALASRIVYQLKARHGDALVVVHGHCPDGVDHEFEREARTQGVRTETHPADWHAHGKAAGPIRNQAMVDLGAEFCLAVHRDLLGSKGTLDCVKRCWAAGIPVWLVDSEDARPRRVTTVETTKGAKH